MNRHLVNSRLLLCWGLVTVFVGCTDIGDVFKAKHKTTQVTSVPAGDATEMEIETNIGSITVTGAEVADCNIAAEITVKAGSKEKARELAEQVRIVTELSSGRLSIKVDKPTELKSKQLTVDFRITAPGRLSLSCASHVGTIRVAQMTGRIKANTNVGSIFCSDAAGDTDLESNVGSVHVAYADAAPAAVNAKIATNVGSIELSIHEKASAKLDASTNIGSIKTSKPITVVGKLGKSVEGSIGGGQGEISLRTNVGSIEIK
jgi:hypothetical protein